MLSAPAVNGWKIFTGIEMEVTTRMCWGQNFLFKTSFLLFWKKKNIARKKRIGSFVRRERKREKKSIFFISFFYKLKKRKNGGNKKMRKTIFGFFSFEAKKNIPTFRLDWLWTGLKPIRNDYFRFSWINIIPKNDNSSERVVA